MKAFTRNNRTGRGANRSSTSNRFNAMTTSHELTARVKTAAACVVCAVVSACVPTTGKENPALPPSNKENPSADTRSSEEQPPASSQQSDTAAARTSLTREDGQAIKDELVRALEQSQLGDRMELLSVTRNATVWTDDEGTLRIGAWSVLSDDAKYELFYRATTGAGPAFKAFLARTAGRWQVNDLRTFHIRERR
jgi:hypothetical protein